MCRLYGFRANEPTKVECTLVHAQNALLIQSRSDLRGISHADGWGIAFYANGLPQVERSHTAAYSDLHFSATAERVSATTVVAHVRNASVGGLSHANTHPFQYGPWVFAHNGRITAFESIRSAMENETDPMLLEHRIGSTDSEQAFFWLLTRMAKAGIEPESKCARLDTLMDVVGGAVKRLAHWCDEEKAEKPAKLNFLITDGRVLVVSRWNNTLWWVLRQGIHDCEVCGIPHIHHDRQADYRAAVLASEPISHETWQELPDQHVLAVEESIHVRTQPI